VLVRLRNSAIIINAQLNHLPLFILHADVAVIIIVIITIIIAADPQLMQVKEDSYKMRVT
jgi:hypothetical protein